MFALLLLPAAGESPAQTLPAPTTFELSLTCGVPSGPCNFVPEDDGAATPANVTTTITVTAAFPSGSGTRATDTVLMITVAGAAGPGSATVNTDFTAVPAFNLTIPANMGVGTMSFDFVGIADAIFEMGGKRVAVTATTTVSSLTPPAAVHFFITDNDSPPVILVSSLDTTSVTEDSGTTVISVTAAWPTGSRPEMTEINIVTFTVSDGTPPNGATAGEDYTAVDPFTATILAGETEGTGSFTLTVNDDTVLETTPETIILTPVSDGSQTAIPATLTIEIVDDDTQADTITLSVDPTSVTEGVGTTTSTASDGVVTTTSAITVTASIADGTATAEDLPVTVALVTGTGVGTAAATDDFTVGTISVITITAGMLTGTGTFMLTVVDDVTLEGDETLVFSGTLGTTTAVYNAIANVTLTIEDNDTQADTITLSLDPASVTEGTVATGTTATTTGGVVTTTSAITVTASIAENTATAEDLPVTVALVTSTGDGFATATDDFTVGTISVITILANERTATGTFMLTVVDDVAPEGDETLVFSGTLGTAVATYNAIANVTLTINDDEAPQADTITLSLDPTSVAEGTGTTTETSEDGVVTTITEITVTASIPDGTATGVALPVTVALVASTDDDAATPSVAAVGATAAVLGDFTLSAITPTSIVIPAGSLTATGTFMLTVVDDEDTEVAETLVFSGTLAAAVTGFMDIENVTLTIVDNDGGASESMEAVLPELARVSVTSVIDVLSGRIAQVASGSLGDGSVSFAGHSSLAQALAANQQRLNDGDLSLLEALAGSSIALDLDGTGTAAPAAGGQAGSSGVGVWASANYDRISSTAPGVGDWDGSQFSLFVGVDGHVSRNTLIGVAASWSKGSTEFDDDPTLEIDTSLLGLNPYIGWHSDDGKKTAWGTVGYSSGDFEQDQQNNLKTDLKMTVLAIGGSTRFAERAGLDFDIKGDLSTAELTTDATSGVAEVKSKAHRARVAVEAEVDKASDSGAHVMRSVALGLRYDGGDGDTGSGLELDGELGWSGRSVSVSGAANVLLFHTGDLKEWGVGGLIRYEPSHAKGRNLTFRAQPSYGPGESGSGQLWDQQVKDLDEDGGEPEARLVMDAGWGLAALSGRALVTPYSGLELSEGGSRVYRLGSRVAVDSIFNIDLAANRTEDGDSPEHGIGLQLGMQW